MLVAGERPPTASSERTNTTWRYDVFGHPRPGKGAMVFTGPDGLRDYRAAVQTECQYVGEGLQSIERTSSAQYVWRPAPSAHHPKPKSAFSGSYGWGVAELVPMRERETPDARIKMNTFLQATEQKITHLYQNAWYPGPREHVRPDTDAALAFNVYALKEEASGRESGRANRGATEPSGPLGDYSQRAVLRERMPSSQQQMSSSATPQSHADGESPSAHLSDRGRLN